MDVEGSLEDGARAGKLLLLQLPLGIAHPVVEVDAVAPHIVLKFLALAPLELVQLLEVGEALCRRLDATLLAVDGLAEELLGADLDRRRRLVLDPRRASRRLHGYGG